MAEHSSQSRNGCTHGSELNLKEDIAAELEDFMLLTRLGIYDEASEFVNQVLWPHLSWFPVAAEGLGFFREQHDYNGLRRVLSELAMRDIKFQSTHEQKLISMYEDVYDTRSATLGHRLRYLAYESMSMSTLDYISFVALHIAELHIYAKTTATNLDIFGEEASNHIDGLLKHGYFWEAGRVFAICSNVNKQWEKSTSDRRHQHYAALAKVYETLILQLSTEPSQDGHPSDSVTRILTAISVKQAWLEFTVRHNLQQLNIMKTFELEYLNESCGLGLYLIFAEVFSTAPRGTRFHTFERLGQVLSVLHDGKQSLEDLPASAKDTLIGLELGLKGIVQGYTDLLGADHAATRNAADKLFILEHTRENFERLQLEHGNESFGSSNTMGEKRNELQALAQGPNPHDSNWRAIFSQVVYGLHILPLIATALLTWVNLTGYLLESYKEKLLSTRITMASTFVQLIFCASIMDIVGIHGSRQPPRFGASHRMRVSSELEELNYIFSGQSKRWSILPRLSRGPNGSRWFPWHPASLALDIIAMLIVAVAISPALSLLAIPSKHDRWLVGGKDIWLLAADHTLWPDILGSEHAKDNDYLPLYTGLGHSTISSMPDLVWYGQPLLGESLSHDLNLSSNCLTIRHKGDEDAFKVQGNSATWAVAAHAVSILQAQNLVTQWYRTDTTATDSGKDQPLTRLNHGFLSTAYTTMHTWNPVVKVLCNTVHQPLPRNGSVNLLFPTVSPFEVSRGSTNRHLDIEVDPRNTVGLPIQWATLPEAAMKKLLSAAAIVTFQRGLHEGEEPVRLHTLTCSVKASWSQGTLIQNLGPATEQTHEPTSFLEREHSERYFRGLRASSQMEASRPVRMDPGWLDTLAPCLSLDMLNLARDDTTGSAVRLDVIPNRVECILARCLVREMSQSGMAEHTRNTQRLGSTTKQEHVSEIRKQTEGEDSIDYLGHRRLTEPFPDGFNTSCFTPLRGNVYVSGYAYSADSTAHYLALALLFLHALLVIGYLPALLRSHGYRSIRKFETNVAESLDKVEDKSQLVELKGDTAYKHGSR
ncbi:hypothetical protein LTR64_000069 [Lithohypha guttulata]|uniref:uncharacterized protein n=1 Tax=Lithohypha guttulata TaxID=1690604 RepID=UPI002DE0EEF5|nr:hypothetical protein LTR51_007431 [Lithohypha guttulata]